MRFLDLDLDFFLNKNAYAGGQSRLGTDYKPWSRSGVRHFLEDRCGLSRDNPLPGRILETHDAALDFWRVLIESGKTGIPFQVTHIDAHPDMWVSDGIYLKSGSLHIEVERGLALIKGKTAHPGNYLTYAIINGWIDSLTWVPLIEYWKKLPKWDGDARSLLAWLKSGHAKESLKSEKEWHVAFKIVPWHKYRSQQPFDFMLLSKSPAFTPPQSDKLIAVIGSYMKQL